MAILKIHQSAAKTKMLIEKRTIQINTMLASISKTSCLWQRTISLGALMAKPTSDITIPLKMKVLIELFDVELRFKLINNF